MSTRIPTLRSKEPSLKWNPDPRSRIHEIPQVDRPREKLFAKGPAALSDVELLALVLGSGTRSGGVLEVATRVLAACDDRLDAIEAAALLRIPGLGRARSAALAAALELARRHLGRGRPTIRSASDALPYLQSIRAEKQEQFACLSLNGAGEVLATRVVTVGLLDTNQVHPREVFADPIADRAASILVAHNHPSGTLAASAEDLALTERLAAAGRLLGIPLLDHLILTADGHLSLKSQGVL